MSSAATPDASRWRSLLTRLPEDSGRKATGLLVALGLEALLLLVLLTLNQVADPRREAPLAVVAFDARDYSETPPAEQPAAKPPEDVARAAIRPPTPPVASVPRPAPSAMPPAAIIPVSPRQMQSFDIANLAKPKAAPAAPMAGPQFKPRFGDSQRVGTAPNGQPMYAAAWYREPTDDELRGYLSTADGPGWALITCRTVPDFRVEDCVGLDEWPGGSNIQRAVLAAAWQFRVKPPRINGVSQVGDWVRIRISYEIVRKEAYGSKPDG